jgi:hypothetical protein
MPTPLPKNTTTLNLPAALLAWIWPGLGHRSLGHRRRGRYICFGILFLVVTGVLVGGIDAVDHKNDSLWFIAQVFCGPIVIAIDAATQNFIVDAPIEKRATMVGLSHVNEIGTLFISMAGLMNFVVILDALQAKRNIDIDRRDKETEQ